MFEIYDKNKRLKVGNFTGYYLNRDISGKGKLYRSMDRINNLYSKKVDLLDEIEKEKKDDPRKEILEVEEEVKICDPFRGFLVPDENGSIRKGSSLDEPKLCKFYSKGFCKYKEECHLSHAQSDCKEHIELGICNRKDCTNRHRQDCKFYNSKKGCERRDSCAFPYRHIATKDPTKDNLNSSKEKNMKSIS